MVDKTEDFVLLERTDLDVVTTEEQSAVIVTTPETRVVTTEQGRTVSVEIPAAVIIAAGQVGPPGMPGADGVDGQDGIDGTAPSLSVLNASGGTLRRGTPVAMESNGTVVKANAINKPRVIGFVQDALINDNTYGLVQLSSVLEGSAGDWEDALGFVGTLIPGSNYYLSTTAGRITTTPDTNNAVCPLGKAISAVKMNIDIEPPVL